MNSFRLKVLTALGSLLLSTPALSQELTTGPVSPPTNSPLFIKLGEARTKKSLVALPPLQYLGAAGAAPNYQSIGNELFNVVTNDLTVSSYFKFIPQSAFLEDTSKTGLRPAPADPKGFNFKSWAQIETDFLIRGAFSIVAGELSFEVYLYHVPKANLVFAKRYKGATSSVRKVAHTFANDVLKALSGQEGMFLSKIAVASDRDGNNWREIFVSDWDGNGINKITNHKTIAMSPAWSPDGERIAYTAIVQRSRTSGRNHDMFLYELKSGKRTLVSYRQGMNSGANFAPDNKHIYLTISQGFAPDIYKMTFDGTLVLKMTNGPNGAMNVEPASTTDGNKVAFSSDRSGKTMIFTMDADGKNVKRITHAGQFNASPSWSPDGKKIAFAGYESDHFDIFVMNADGTGMIRLTKATKPNGKMSNNEDPTFSPDGRFVMYTSDRTGKNQVYLSTADGAEERQVTKDNHNYYKPRWSPNLE